MPVRSKELRASERRLGQPPDVESTDNLRTYVHMRKKIELSSPGHGLYAQDVH
jgi:hypothetical protein